MLFRLYFGSSYYWLNWTFAYDRATRALLIMYMSNFELNKWTFPLCSLHTSLYYNYCQLPQIFSNGSELEVLTVHYATSTNRKQIFTLFRTAHHPQLWQDITRHNTILEIIANWIASNISKDQTLYVDSPSSTFCSINEIFHETSRPDIAISNKSGVVVFELTVCYESNIEKSRTYKENKYKNLHQNLKLNIPSSKLRVFTLEITVLGFISDISEFLKFAKLPKLPSTLKHSLISSVIMSSYNIYRSRNSLN